jgi:hypothetical protein
MNGLGALTSPGSHVLRLHLELVPHVDLLNREHREADVLLEAWRVSVTDPSVAPKSSTRSPSRTSAKPNENSDA